MKGIYLSCRRISLEDAKKLVNDIYQHEVDGKPDEYVWKSLHYACKNNNEDLIELLLSKGAGMYYILKYSL